MQRLRNATGAEATRIPNIKLVDITHNFYFSPIMLYCSAQQFYTTPIILIIIMCSLLTFYASLPISLLIICTFVSSNFQPVI